MEIERSLRSICLSSNFFFGRFLIKKESYRIENGKVAVYLHRAGQRKQLAKCDLNLSKV